MGIPLKSFNLFPFSFKSPLTASAISITSSASLCISFASDSNFSLSSFKSFLAFSIAASTCLCISSGKSVGILEIPSSTSSLFSINWSVLSLLSIALIATSFFFSIIHFLSFSNPIFFLLQSTHCIILF